MLPPPHLRQTLLRSTHHPMSALTITVPRRSFWGWRKPTDWSSHLDPLYHRLNRVRTLKTRAKLLNKLRRRGKFEWDGNAANFFTPKHVRWASRWDGREWRTREWKENEEEKNKPKSGREVEGMGEESGYELSEREKIWREQMHAMRKRIESDPYEAVFGKRFEPFWSPLVPSWMREEMGLPVWQSKDFSKQGDASKAAGTLRNMSELLEKDIAMKKQKTEAAEKKSKLSSGQSDTGTQAVEGKPEPSNPTTYSYASSSSWDSWSNKTKRVEWDSVSGAKRNYEYDPVSNRMVLVSSSYPGRKGLIEGEKPAAPMVNGTQSSATSVNKSPINQDQTQAVDIPVKQPGTQRKSIPIPPPLSQPSYNVPMGFQPKPTSIGPVKPTAVAAEIPKPAALSAFPDKTPLTEIWKADRELATLTAEDVRAGMPKLKSSTRTTQSNRPPATNPQQQGEQDFSSLDAQPHIDALLKKSQSVSMRGMGSRPEMSEWDQAEMDVILQRELENLHKKREKLLKDEKGLFHIERQKREVMKLDQRIQMLGERVAKLDARSAGSPTKPMEATTSTSRLSGNFMAAAAAAHKHSSPIDAQSDTASAGSTAKQTESTASTSRLSGNFMAAAAAAHKHTSPVLQSSLERMQTKDRVEPKTPAAEEVIDADDAAAHECTEHLPATASTTSHVPEQWAKQAELLQAARVERTAGKVAYPDMLTLITNSAANSNGRDVADPALLHQPKHMSVSEAQAKQEASGFRRAHSSGLPGMQPVIMDRCAVMSKVFEQKSVERDIQAEKIKAMLENEVKNTKARMEAHEGRYEHRHDSNVTMTSDSAKSSPGNTKEQHISDSGRFQEKLDSVRAKYTSKLKTMREELETAYKQSSVHSDKHLERIKDLEAALKTQVTLPRSDNVEKKLQEKYAAKIKALRDELEMAYKQSTVHSEKHLERIKELQTQLEEAKKSNPPSTPSVVAPLELTQAEGDISHNVGKFMGSEKWYKQPATTPQSIKREMEKAERKRKDRELVREVRKIYEDAYGVIGTEQEQRRSSVQSRVAELMKNQKKGVVEVESDVDLGDALAKYENDLKVLDRNHERRMAAAREREAHEGVQLVNGAERSTASSTKAAKSSRWAIPPLYQILAYDSGNDRISSATTTSNFAGATEKSISISEALSQLYAPTKFVGELAELQGKGWEVVHAGKDVLVFRKVEPSTPTTSTATEEAIVEPAVPAEPSAAESTGVATEAQQQPDEPSPFDNATKAEAEEEEDYDIRHYPRVKREEYPVFTGTRQKWKSARRQQAKRGEEREVRRQRRARKWRWVMGTGLGFASVAYLVGGLEESARKEDARRKVGTARFEGENGGRWREG